MKAKMKFENFESSLEKIYKFSFKVGKAITKMKRAWDFNPQVTLNALNNFGHFKEERQLEMRKNWGIENLIFMQNRATTIYLSINETNVFGNLFYSLLLRVKFSVTFFPWRTSKIRTWISKLKARDSNSHLKYPTWRFHISNINQL